MKNLTSFMSLLLLLVTILKASAWSNDVQVSSNPSLSNHCIAAKTNGTLYIGESVANPTPGSQPSVTVYSSSNYGTNWTELSTVLSIQPILRTKMVRTVLDSVYLIFATNSTIRFLNVESGVTGQFNASAIVDFDAVASMTGNAIYLFVEEPGNTSIRRYATLDAGLTWSPLTATVTTQGARPRLAIYMNQLILNYYGPVAVDTISSKIRAARYNESTPGTLTPGAFIDINSNLVPKKQFQTVMANGKVWFFFSEGNPETTIKCNVSTNNGISYSAEQVVAGSIAQPAFSFDACSFNSGGSEGCYLTYFNASSVVPPTPDPMMITYSTTNTPFIFSTPVAYSDFNVTTSPSWIRPAVVSFINNAVFDVGVAWVQDDGNGSAIYFDHELAVTSVAENQNDYFALIQNPANRFLKIRYHIREDAVLRTFNMNSQLLHQQQLSRNCQNAELPVGNLPDGIYFYSIYSENFSKSGKIVIKNNQ